jgi:hypothetical protein
MMYPQRAVEPEGADARAALELWRPGPPVQDVTEDDDYVTVDDRGQGMVTLVVSAWPSIDRQGRLVFPSYEGGQRVVVADAHAFTDLVNGARRAAGVPERGVRVGDVFRARDTAGSVEGWRDVADVTSQAREAAKAALYGAVAPRMDVGTSGDGPGR